ncbi:hypothetical protein LRP88_02266 [Fusarium phalaenopsidis]
MKFVEENFKSGLKWKIPEDTTEYGPRKKKRDKDGSEDEKEVVKSEKIQGVNDVSGVINPDAPELELRFERVKKGVKKSSSSDSSTDLEAAIQGGEHKAPLKDFEDNNDIADLEPETLLEGNAFSAPWKTVEALQKRGKWLSSIDIFNSEDQDQAVKVFGRFKAWAVENITKLDRDGKGASHFKSIACQKMPCARQEDGFSCGIFVVKIASALIEGKPTPRDVDPEHERAYYASELSKMALMASADIVDVDVKVGEAPCPSSSGMLRLDRYGTAPICSCQEGLLSWNEATAEVAHGSVNQSG